MKYWKVILKDLKIFGIILLVFFILGFLGMLWEQYPITMDIIGAIIFFSMLIGIYINHVYKKANNKW